jgi:NAD(P)-dependent dehydrogenase (short-subunit alcohol dehydrogenase family)
MSIAKSLSKRIIAASTSRIVIEKQASPNDPSLARQGFSGLIAMGRYGTDVEVANVVAFLASDEACYCTGGIYPVDGGFLAA